MIKVSSIVKDIVFQSETISESLSKNLLNYSHCAEMIQDEVELKALKPIKKGTIVAALSRLKKEVNKLDEITPNIVIDDLTVKAPLVEVTVEKTQANVSLLRELYQSKLTLNSEFITATQGMSEITIIASAKSQPFLENLFQTGNIIATITNLVALSAKFNSDYINTPNMIYSTLRTLALKRINIIELVSTFSELTFIIKKPDLKVAFLSLSKLYQE